MKLYQYKAINCGFVVLCHDRNIKLVKGTCNSIKNHYGPNYPIICSIDSTATEADLEELNKICPTVVGENSYSSLINVGIKNSATKWNIIIFAGAFLRSKLDRKFSFFIESEKDILFPISEGKTNFVDGTLNGLMINKKTFLEVGPFSTTENIDICKLLWSDAAMQKGCKFKAIASSKMC